MGNFDSQGRFVTPVTVVDPATAIGNFTADGRMITPVSLIDQTTGLPYAPTAIAAQGAQKILRASQAVQPTAVNAISPTLAAVYAATTFATPVFANVTDPVITPTGGGWRFSASAAGYKGAVADAGAADPFGVAGQGIRFGTDTQLFEVNMIDGLDSAHLRVRYREAGGPWTWLSASDYALPGTDFGPYNVKYDLGSSKPRIIEVYYYNGCVIQPYAGAGAINIPAPYSIWKAPLTDTPTMMVISDSYGRGSTGATSYTTLSRGHWVDVMGDLLGANTISSSLGGTGYLNAGGSKTFRQRIGDATRFGPVDMVIVAGGANDNASGAAAITAEVALYVQAVKAAQPNAIILGLGPWRAPSLNTSTATNNAVAAGWTPYLDSRTFYLDLFAANWQQPSVTAWNTLYQGSDNAHPNDAQHALLGRLAADEVLSVAHTVAGQ